jgi:hypothetical protein
MNGKRKWASYPPLNARSDIYFVLQRESERIHCEQLQRLMNVSYYDEERCEQGIKRVNVDLELRDAIVDSVLIRLKWEASPFRMELDDWYWFVELCVAYNKLLTMERIDTEYWAYVWSLLHDMGFYKTYKESSAAAELRILQMLA